MAKKKAPEKQQARIGFRVGMPAEAGKRPVEQLSEDDLGADVGDGGGLDDQGDGDGGSAPDQDQVPDLNFVELTAEIGKRFKPAASYEEAGLRLSTGEVFSRLQGFYQSDTYTHKMVFDALKELGFVYDDPFQSMEFVWLFK